MKLASGQPFYRCIYWHGNEHTHLTRLRYGGHGDEIIVPNSVMVHNSDPLFCCNVIEVQHDDS
jgi:hypothetical protein